MNSNVMPTFEAFLINSEVMPTFEAFLIYSEVMPTFEALPNATGFFFRSSYHEAHGQTQSQSQLIASCCNVHMSLAFVYNTCARLFAHSLVCWCLNCLDLTLTREEQWSL